MKTYNKQRLNEYAKELFALCLEKGIDFKYHESDETITLYCFKTIDTVAYLCSGLYNHKTNGVTPIWELIEKVKAL